MTKPSTAYNKLDGDKLRDKCVNNLSSKLLTHAEKLLLQKIPKFAVSLSCGPLIDYITVTKHIYESTGENNIFWKTNCTEDYFSIKYVISMFVAKSKPIHPNITTD